ncbi:MAG: Gfo/Idh/MocA family oxidoreductase [Candidatus Omnitrophica bacterium]|nr:Gfo/Idh/MocA family oxidoreductase [Candidatus Omnitrophota bacterium]
MKQLIQNLKTGKLALKDVPYPMRKANGLLVKTANSIISVGTEKSIIDFARKNLIGKARARRDLLKRAVGKVNKEGLVKVFRESMSRLDEPFPLGYSASGTVVETGENVKSFNAGDRVAIAGSDYAHHAEYNFVPEDLCFSIPKKRTHEYLDFEDASFCMMGGIAVNGINEAELEPASSVAVIGLGLLGLLTAQILRGLGHKVIGIDIDDEKVSIARKLGFEHSINANKDDAVKLSMSATDNKGVSGVLITADSKGNKPIDIAQRIAAYKGRIVLVGVCDINLDRKYFWDKELVFKVSKIAGSGEAERKNIECFLRLMAEDKVSVKGLITHRFDFNQAISAYEMVLGGRSPSVAVVLEYLKGDLPEDGHVVKLDAAGKKSEIAETSENKKKNIGLIGGGLFAKNVLLPALSKVKGVRLNGIATTRGMTSEHLAGKFGFAYSTTDHKKLLEDDDIGSVFILTRHDLHARFVTEALQHGKDVFVEKPLCLNKKELQEIISAYRSQGHKVTRSPELMLGFNRRYTAHARDIKEFFESGEPFVINCRINAGYIEPTHWTQSPEEGGGRLIGEVCHFVDLLQFITSSRPVEVYTEGISNSTGYAPDDNIISVIKFADGSIANITYTSKGSKSYPREILEIYQKDSVYYLEDFRKAVKVNGGKKEKKNLISQDMGYAAELEYFFSNGNKNRDFRDYVLNSLTIFAMTESLKTHKIISIEGIMD